MRTFHVILPALLLTVLPAPAAEDAILTNGFRIHADRHEVDGDNVKLYSGSGFTELPASQIAAFEVKPGELEESVSPAAPVPALAPSAVPTPAAPTPAPTVQKPPTPLELAADAARRNNLPEALIRSIMHAESGFQSDAVSPKGAIGLMQLMPETAHELHADPRDPKQNVEAGTAYLRSLLIKYFNNDDQVQRAVAAYNAGPGAVDHYNGVPPYRETQDYVRRVINEYLKSVPNAQ